MIYLLSIQHYFLELTSFSKALNHFVWHISSKVDAECKGWVSRLHQVSQLLWALQLKSEVVFCQAEEFRDVASAKVLFTPSCYKATEIGYCHDGAYLVFLEPLLQKLLAALLQHGATELQRFKLVQLSLVKQYPKVLEQGRRLPRLSWYTLELPDCITGT